MKSSIQKLGQKTKSIDMFGEGVTLRVSRDDSTRKTFLGSFLTLVVSVITITYGFKRYAVMREYEDTVHQSSISP